MTEKLYEGIYKYDCFLPKNPLKYINIYIIVSEDRSLIIDTGFNEPTCKEAMIKAIEELGLDPKKTDLFLTHLHADHTGLAADLYDLGVTVYTGETTAAFLNQMTEDDFWPSRVREWEYIFGLEPNSIDVEKLPPHKYRYTKKIPLNTIVEGHIFKLGPYEFEALDFHGHEPGLMGIYDKKHGFLFAGDHILEEITPNVGAMDTETDILQIYFDSLNKAKTLGVKRTFPAHRSQIDSPDKRINELLEHHQHRLDEIIEILEDNKDNKGNIDNKDNIDNIDGMTVRDIASKMTWDIRANSWEEFPANQKWFASTEAMAHLERLRHDGQITRTAKGTTLYYRKV